MFLRIKMCKKMHMISFQNYRESGDKVQDDVITAKHIVSHTMRVNTTFTRPKCNPDYWML